MLILMPVEGNTKSGRKWVTQIGIDSEKEVIKQMNDYHEQLEYERSQLL